MTWTHVNYLAVIVSAIVAWLIGAVWYSPALFARHWVAAHGFTEEQTTAMRKNAGPAYGISLLCFVIMAFVLAVIIRFLGAHSLEGGLKVGALVWFGFFATLTLMTILYSNKSIRVYWIDASYQLVYMLVMGAILGAWR
jgi:hypothetical protein